MWPLGNRSKPYGRTGGIVTIGVQGIVFDQDRRVLLVRHRYVTGWHFPGGGVERRETLTEALARELKEETGIVLIEPAQLFGIYAHFDEFPGDHIALFVANGWERPRMPGLNAEIAAQDFFALDQLPLSTTEATKRRLREVLTGVERNTTW